jgi:glycine dehydrogenase subunit 1
LTTYARAGTFDVRFVDGGPDGVMSFAPEGDIAEALRGTDVAALLVGSPNVLGNLEDVFAAVRSAHDAGALLVVGANPLMLGVLEAPGVQGADIVVGEGQPLGNAMNFGGPAFGFFACRDTHVRHLPGRLVGRTVDVDGNDAFVLTLSTREQHIRREKATSNICSNQALCALAAAVYLAALGREGVVATAHASIAKAHYLRDELLKTGRFTAVWNAPFAHEFTLAYQGDVAEMRASLLERGFLAGVPFTATGPLDHVGLTPDLVDSLVIFAATEKRTRAEIDAFAEEVASL